MIFTVDYSGHVERSLGARRGYGREGGPGSVPDSHWVQQSQTEPMVLRGKWKEWYKEKRENGMKGYLKREERGRGKLQSVGNHLFLFNLFKILFGPLTKTNVFIII